MRYFAILYLVVCSSLHVYSQNSNTWIAFWNADTTLIGYKDATDTVKIEPKFMGFTTAGRFEHIIAAMEEKNGNFESYYLTKSGRIVGRDSLYIFDNSADCESEGFIRFSDKATDKVGLFDKAGNVKIPAEYNYLSTVQNGLLVALKGAKKTYFDKQSDCEHYRWKGGDLFLIDTEKNILVKNFNYDGYLNFYSLQIESIPSTDSTKQSFLGVNGQYFIFTDFEKEFNHWIRTKLLDNFTIENLLEHSYDKLKYWSDSIGWIGESRNTFLNRNFELIKSRLTIISNESTDYSIFIEGLNPYMFIGEEFEKYYNNCGEAKESKYPVMNVVISNKNGDDLIQAHFDFLRTDCGYKLISLTIRNGKIN